MELRPDTSYKENVPPRPAAPLRPEPWRFLKNLGVGLGSGHGQWVPVHQARRGGPAATPSPRTVLRQEPCLVQTNLASPGPSPGLALEDTIVQGATSSFLQQSNLQPQAGRPHLRGQSFAMQQSNLSLSKTSFVVRGNRTSPHLWSEPQESFSPHTLPWGSPLCRSRQLTCPSLSLRQSQPGSPDTPCPDFRPLAGFIPQDGCPQPGTRSWFSLGRWTSGPVGEPLTLEDPAVPAQSQAQAPSHASIQQSLASVRCLEHEASRFRCWASQKPLGPVRQDLWASGNREARLCSSTFSSAAWGVLPGQEGGEGAPREQVRGEEERTASSHPPDTISARSALQVEPGAGAPGARLPPPRDGPIFLLWCHQKGLARQERGIQREAAQAPPRTQRAVRPPKAGHAHVAAPVRVVPLETQCQRAWLCRCFGAWQRFAQRGARCRDRLADRRVGTLNTCLQQWVQMKQLRASDGMKVTQLSLCRQKAGTTALRSPAPGPATAQGPRAVAQAPRLLLEQGQGSLQEACRRLALHRVLLLWRMQLSQHRQADIDTGPREWPGDTETVTGQRAIEGCGAVGLQGHRHGALPRGLGPDEEASPPQNLEKPLPVALPKQSSLVPGGEAGAHSPAPSYSFFLQGLQQRTLQHVLRQWRSRAWGLCTPSSSTRTTSALESPGSGPGREASLGYSTPCGSLERPPRDPALLETLRATFLQAARRRRQEQSLLLWQARAQQARAVASRYQRTLQRRWSHWTTAQGTQRELAAHWAWAQSCKAALGLWRRQLAQWWAAEQWAQEQGRRLAQDALRRWHSCWQRQQILQEKYQAWAQIHLQGLQRAMFQSWQWAAAQRRHMVTGPEQLLLRSHFRSWCGLVREAGVLQAQHRAFQDGRKRRALEAAFAAWREALVAAAQTQEQHVAWDAIAHWSRAVQQGWARKQLRRAWAQQAFTAWRGALGLRLEAHWQAEEGAQAQVQAGVALCWTLSVRESYLCQVSRAYAARKLCVQVLEAWAQAAAQAQVQRAAFAQLQQAGLRLLLRTHWAQWQTALLRVRQEAWAEAEEAGTVHPRPRADHTHCLRLASRGRLLLLTDAPAPWKQTRSCWTQGPGLGLPGAAQHHHLSGQSERQGMLWAQGDREQDLRWPLAPCRPPLRHAVQLWLQPPVHCHRAQGLPLCMTPSRPPTGPAGDCSSESTALKGTASPAPGLPAGQVPGNCMAALATSQP
ncbi:uncharacterized protein C1orf167 homolog [Dugong dugon]